LFIKKESEMPKPHAPKPPYPAQFRQQMVELVQAGRKPSELAKEFNCHTTSILNWVRQSGGSVPLAVPSSAQGQALSTAERQELIELRRKLRQVQMERDILAKATAWFAGKSEKTSMTFTNS
jgi:transposase